MSSLLRSALAASAAILLVTIASVAPASAHVEASGMETAGITTVTLNVEHGCGELDLTGLRVQLPEGSTGVTAENPESWTNTISATEISWSGGPQPAHEELAFEFALKLAQPAGTVVRFPTIELCPGAEIAWIEVTPEGGPEPEHPAPQITVGGSGSMEHMAMDPAPDSSSTTKAGPAATMAPEQTPITQSGSETHNAGLVVLLIVMAIIIGGAVVLYLRNRRPKTDS